MPLKQGTETLAAVTFDFRFSYKKDAPKAGDGNLDSNFMVFKLNMTHKKDAPKAGDGNN